MESKFLYGIIIVSSIIIIGVIIYLIKHFSNKDNSNKNDQTTDVSVPPSVQTTYVSVPPSVQTTDVSVPPSVQTSIVSPPEPITFIEPTETQLPFTCIINIFTFNFQNTISNIQISNVIIKDQDNNIIVPLATYNIKKGDSFYRTENQNGVMIKELITPTTPFYSIIINPTNIKNITIYGNNLSSFQMMLASNKGPDGIGAITKLTDDPVQSYNYDLQSIDPNNPLVKYVSVISNDYNKKVDVSSIIITDNKDNIITPIKIDASTQEYIVEIKPSQIKNIKITGNNLNLIPLTVSNYSVMGMPKGDVSIPLTNASVQNYIYSNKQLTLESTSTSTQPIDTNLNTTTVSMVPEPIPPPPVYTSPPPLSTNLNTTTVSSVPGQIPAQIVYTPPGSADTNLNTTAVSLIPEAIPAPTVKPPITIVSTPDTTAPFIDTITITPAGINNNISSIPISNVVITDKNNNIVIPLATYYINTNDSYYIDAVGHGKKFKRLISLTRNPLYIIKINPTDIKNIKIYGDNLRYYLMTLTRDISNKIISYIHLTDAPVQNYIYSNDKLTLDTTPVREGFYNIHRTMTLLDTFYLPLHQ